MSVDKEIKMYYLVYLPLGQNNFGITSLQNSYQKALNFESNNISVAEDGTRIVAVVTHSNNSDEKKEAIQLRYFKSKNVFNFYMNFDYATVDPFVLVCHEDEALFELSWNGKVPNFKNILTTKRYVWSMDEETFEKERELEKVILDESKLSSESYFPELHQQLREKLFFREASNEGFGQEIYCNSLIKDGNTYKMMYDDGKSRQVKELFK